MAIVSQGSTRKSTLDSPLLVKQKLQEIQQKFNGDLPNFSVFVKKLKMYLPPHVSNMAANFFLHYGNTYF